MVIFLFIRNGPKLNTLFKLWRCSYLHSISSQILKSYHLEQGSQIHGPQATYDLGSSTICPMHGSWHVSPCGSGGKGIHTLFSSSASALPFPPPLYPFPQAPHLRNAASGITSTPGVGWQQGSSPRPYTHSSGRSWREAEWCSSIGAE